MFIINSYWYKNIFEPTLSLSETINFYENVSYSTEFGSLKDAVISFYENVELSASSPPEYQGFGTEQDPYLIYTAEQFAAIPDKSPSWYRVMDNLDFTGIYYIPKNFYGYIDGQNYVLSNIDISNWHSLGASTRYASLFGYVTGSTGRGVIRNLILENCNYWVSGSATNAAYFGGIVGRGEGGTQIYNCHIRSSSFRSTGNSYQEFFGGIVGYMAGSAIQSCSVVNSVFSCSKATGTNGDYAGIIVGQVNAAFDIYKTFVQSCSIDHRRSNFTSIVGAGFKGGNSTRYIYDCYMKDVLVTGNAVTGSIPATGMHVNGNYVIRCYAVVTASMSTNQTFLPISDIGTGTSSFYNVEVMGYVSGSGGPKTTTEMLNQDTYTFSSSWDFTNVWITGSLNGGYPYLRDNPPPY